MSVAGTTDGIAPVYDPDGRWTIWGLHEIFTGTEGNKRYVPKVGDWVINKDTAEYWRVVDVDMSTMIARLDPIDNAVNVRPLDEFDRLLGVGPTWRKDTQRAMIDRSVIPYTLSVDGRCYVNAVDASYAKIFRGSEIDGTSKVISAYYDSAGNLVSENIPLELVEMQNGVNYHRRVPMVCNTTEDIEDNELLYICFYSDRGSLLSKDALIAENTAFVRSTDASKKYVVAITLETPFLSEADPLLIQYPLNVPLEGMNFYGVVHYSDGDELRMPVDGTKFSLFGAENFVSTIPTQKFPIQLKYKLGSNEIAVGAIANGSERFFTADYKAMTMKAEGAYSVKLFGYPVWVNQASGYRLEWYLFNMDRDTYFKATAHVVFNENTPAFDPIAYGINQVVSVSVDLNKVNGIYKNYIHTQLVEIVLVRPGTEHTGSNWTVGFEPGQNPPFGRNNHANMTFINQNLRKVVIHQDEVDLDVWLDRMFYMTKPLYDSYAETRAPKPNMFALVVNGVETEFRIEQWRDELTFSQSLADSGTLFVKFFKRTPETDILLGMTGMPVWQIN